MAELIRSEFGQDKARSLADSGLKQFSIVIFDLYWKLSKSVIPAEPSYRTVCFKRSGLALFPQKLL